MSFCIPLQTSAEKRFCLNTLQQYGTWIVKICIQSMACFLNILRNRSALDIPCVLARFWICPMVLRKWKNGCSKSISQLYIGDMIKARSWRNDTVDWSTVVHIFLFSCSLVSVYNTPKIPSSSCSRCFAVPCSRSSNETPLLSKSEAFSYERTSGYIVGHVSLKIK